jgi:hypothetical protein
MIYTSTCVATIVLRRARHAGYVEPASFVVPFGPFIPLLATAISVAMIAGATAGQLLGGAAALLIGAIVFAANRRLVVMAARRRNAAFAWRMPADDRQR